MKKCCLCASHPSCLSFASWFRLCRKYIRENVLMKEGQCSARSRSIGRAERRELLRPFGELVSCRGGSSETLCGIADDCSHNSPRKHNREVIVVGTGLHRGDCESEQKSDTQTKKNTQRQ